MRLIDADVLMDLLEKGWKTTSRDTFTHHTIDRTDVEGTPTVDAVPVIRCKDCVYWKEYCRVVDGVTSHHVCSKKRELDGLMHRTKADDFCSWAERKEE